jgi:hypothetical protein
MLIDAVFPVYGSTLNADHNYYLFAALCSLVPEFHELPGFCFNTINGLPDGKGSIKLGDKSILRIRFPVEYADLIRSLSKVRFTVNGCKLNLDSPRYETLKTSDTLSSRLVTINTDDVFLYVLEHQLEKLGVNAKVIIGDRKSVRITKSRPYDIWGYKVTLKNLSPENSIKIQEIGLGGKRRLGCGVFI